MKARLAIAVCAGIAAWSATNAHAQFTAKGNWTAIQNTLSNTGTTASTPTFTTYSSGSSVGQAKLLLSATAQGGTVQSQKEQRVTMTQTFSLGGQSIVQVPRYYNGDISFFGGAGNLSVGLNFASWEITDTGTNTVVATWSTGSGLNSAPTGFSANTANLATANLPAGNYKIDVKLTSDGYTRPLPTDSPPAGTGVQLDWHGGFKGASTSIEAWPVASWNSRAAVSAPIGRTGYGVNGAGVDVGLIEVGRPYRTGLGGADTGDWSGTHASLAGRLFFPASIYAEEIKTKYRDEHAQATASVIGSADANTGNAGIAPGVTITTYAVAADLAAGGNGSTEFRNAVTSLTNAGMRVINMSMTSFNINNGNDPAADNLYLDQHLNANQNLVFVKSSGNNAAGATPGVTAPGTAYNGITVGGLDMTLQRRFTSSFGNATLNPFKPDIVAPGQFINAAAAFGGGFTRGFTGEAFDVTPNPTVGAVTGTSFAAPHVAGAASLLKQFYDQNSATHDQNAKVIKAVLLNSATTSNVQHQGGGAWAQVTSVGGQGQTVVERSLDPELGAGMLNVHHSLRQYAPPEVQLADGNTNVDLNINVGNQPFWWDHEQAAGNGTVDYLLTNALTFMKATLVWNAKNNGSISPMSLKLFYEGNTNGNSDGYDTANPNDDQLVAETLTTFGGFDQNVGQIFMDLPAVPEVEFQNLLNLDYGRYYLSVFSQSGDSVDYGLAVTFVPEPASISLLLIGVQLLRRRRAA